MVFVYRYRNNVTKNYSHFQFIQEEPETWFRHTHNIAVLHPEQLINNDLHFCTCEFVGTYDELRGDIEYSKEDLSFDIQADFAQIKVIKEQTNA